MIILGAILAGLLMLGIGHADETAPVPAAASPATPSPPKPDPSGTTTGNVSDVPAAKAGEPTLAELANTVGHNRVAINIIWTLIAGFLVMFMQPGFAMVETGFTRAKNAVHTMAMNLMIYPLGMLGFYICGFAFMFGGLGPIATLGGYAGLNHEVTLTLFGKPFGLLGGKGFFLSGSSYDVAVFALFLFQMVFMDTTATIPTGAMARSEEHTSELQSLS
jgi:Amt family ammonium transporter